MDVSIIRCEVKLTSQKKSIFSYEHGEAALDQSVALSIHVILKLYHVGNQGSCDFKLQVTMTTFFSVKAVLSICYNSNFGLSEDESSCDKGEEVHAYLRPNVIAPE